jgi:hypothetical protein
MTDFFVKVSNLWLVLYLNLAALTILIDPATFTIAGTKVDVDSGVRQDFLRITLRKTEKTQRTTEFSSVEL